MTLIASSFFAGLLVSTASAHPPLQTANDTKAALETKTKTSNGILEYTDAGIPIGDDLNSSNQDHRSNLADYIYSEVAPEKKPADIVLNSLKDIPVGNADRGN